MQVPPLSVRGFPSFSNPELATYNMVLVDETDPKLTYSPALKRGVFRMRALSQVLYFVRQHFQT